MNKHIVYYNRWEGWSVHRNNHHTRLGNSIKWGKTLRLYCEKHYKRYGFSIGHEGWEL